MQIKWPRLLFQKKEFLLRIKVMEIPIIHKGCSIPKGWGEELILVNNELYCGKLLIFRKDSKFSMHYHMKKDETWYVINST